MVYGIWYMVYGVWCMVYGEYGVLSEDPSTIHHKPKKEPGGPF
jgi:hypothetical protein